METLVVAQHRNHYYSRPKAHSPARLGSSSSRDFRGIDCRSFHSGTGILPTPLKSYSSPVIERPYSSSPKSPSSPASSYSDRKTQGEITPKSAPIPINGRTCNKIRSLREEVPDRNLLLSELWAGPTYSNSPPPSSLPIPKFSVRPKRTVSLDLPGSSLEIEMHHSLAKSAPASPAREHSPSTRDLFGNADSATKTLRRILNLNINDDVDRALPDFKGGYRRNLSVIRCGRLCCNFQVNLLCMSHLWFANLSCVYFLCSVPQLVESVVLFSEINEVSSGYYIYVSRLH